TPLEWTLVAQVPQQKVDGASYVRSLEGFGQQLRPGAFHGLERQKPERGDEPGQSTAELLPELVAEHHSNRRRCDRRDEVHRRARPPDLLRDVCPKVDAYPGQVMVPQDLFERVGVRPLLDEEPLADRVTSGLDVPQRQPSNPKRQHDQCCDDDEILPVTLEDTQRVCREGTLHAQTL